MKVQSASASKYIRIICNSGYKFSYHLPFNRKMQTSFRRRRGTGGENGVILGKLLLNSVFFFCDLNRDCIKRRSIPLVHQLEHTDFFTKIDPKMVKFKSRVKWRRRRWQEERVTMQGRNNKFGEEKEISTVIKVFGRVKDES